MHRCVATIASRLERQSAQIGATICAALTDEIPELRGDGHLTDLLAASVQANVETIFQPLLHAVPVDRIAVPRPALEYARRLAQHDVAVHTLVRAYRLGQRHMTELVFDALRALDVQPTTRVSVIETITTVVFEYVDRVSQQVVGAYESERVQWLENQNSIQAMRVRDLLEADTEVDIETVSAAIGYPLQVQHLGLVVWRDDAEDDVLARLQEFIGGLASAVNASEPPLFAAVDRSSAWVWLPFRSAPGELAARVRGYARARRDALNIAMGALGSGVSGFRRSHRQAQRARAAASGREPRSSQCVLVAATDPGVMASAVLGTHIGEVREWVADVLGDLASNTDDAAVLRETLRVFLHPGSTPEVAARDLNLSFNALRSRVERAVERRGRPIDDRGDVELALFVCHWYGSAVLRPA